MANETNLGNPLESILTSPEAQQEAQVGLQVPGSLDQMKRAAQAQAFEEETTATFLNWTKKKILESEQQPFQSVEELKLAYPDIDFEGPQRKNVAEFMANLKRKEKANSDFVSAGGGLSWWQQTKAGLLPGFTDPLNIATGVAGEALVPLKFAGKVATKLGMPSKFAAESVQSVIGNLVGNYAADIPTYLEKQELEQKTDLGTMFAVSTGSALLMSGVGMAIRRALDNVRLKSDEALKTEISKKVAAEEANAKTPPAMQSDPVKDGQAPKQGYKTPYVELEHASEVTFFGNPDGSSLVPETGEILDGVQLSDNPLVANNKGSYQELRVKKDAKLLNVNRTSKEVEMIREEFNTRAGTKVPGRVESFKDLASRLSVENAAGNIPDNYQATLKSVLEDMGYHGLADVHSVGGNPSHNKLTLFDDSQLEKGELRPQDPTMLTRAEPEDLRKAHDDWVADAKNKQAYDERTVLHLEEVKGQNFTPEQVRTFVNENKVRNAAELKLALKKLEESPQLEMELPAVKAVQQADADIEIELKRRKDLEAAIRSELAAAPPTTDPLKLKEINAKLAALKESAEAMERGQVSRNFQKMREDLRLVREHGKAVLDAWESLDVGTQPDLLQAGKLEAPEAAPQKLSSEARQQLERMKQELSDAQLKEQTSFMDTLEQVEQPSLFNLPRVPEEVKVPEVMDAIGVPANATQLSFEDLINATPVDQLELMTPKQAAEYMMTRERLTKIANALGLRDIKVVSNPELSNLTTGTAKGVKDKRFRLEIPKEDAVMWNTRLSKMTPNQVYAHELGHFLTNRSGLYSHVTRNSFHKNLKNVEGYEALVEFSKKWKPDVWTKAESHAVKPEEVIADAIGAVLLGEKPKAFLDPVLKHLKMTAKEFGLDLVPEHKPIVIGEEELAKAAEVKAKAAEAPKTADVQAEKVKNLEVENARRKTMSDKIKDAMKRADDEHALAAKNKKLAEALADCATGSKV